MLHAQKANRKLMKVLYSTAALFVLAGSLFKLQHWWPNAATSLIWFGFLFGTIVSSYDSKRLKKIIKELEAKIPPTEE